MVNATVIDNPSVEHSEAATPGLDDLHALLQSFMDSTQQLESTHTLLQQQVASLQGELIEARAKCGQMAAGIAHEIRNPLGSIQLYVQMLADDRRDDPAGAQMCGKINRAVRRMDAIVNDVLQFARDTRIRPQPIALGRLADDALRCCESLIRTSAVTVYRSGDDALQVDADASLLNVALANVIRNAIEAICDRQAAQISIELANRRMLCPDGQRAERAIIAVEDNGPGMPDDVIDRMFNPFFTTRETGTGLGLAIVHRIIDAHGGHVAVSNKLCEESGRILGARFELAIPMCQPSEQPDLCEVEVALASQTMLNHELRG